MRTLSKLFLGLAFLAAGLFAGETGPVRFALNPQGTSGGDTGQLRFYELAANGSNFVAIKAPDAITTTLTFILPSADGTTGQVLQTNGSGLLSWVSAAAGLADGNYGAFTVSGSGTVATLNANSVVTTNITNSNVTLAKIANGTALSVLGVTGNASAAYADIVAASDHQVMRRSGTAVAFGALNLAQSAAVTGILTGPNGGTGNGFMDFTGPTTSTKTFTLPNASSTILTTNAAVTVGQGGTGLAAGTSGGVPYFNSTSTMASSGALAASQLVLGGGAGASPTTLAAPTSGQLLIGNTTTPAWVTMGTDATISNTGALTIANNAITTAKITDANVTTAKILDANVTLAKLESRARPGENILINGGMDLFQRGTTNYNATSSASNLEGLYVGVDRWFWITNAGGVGTPSYTHKRVDASAEGNLYGLEVGHSGGTTNRHMCLSQIVEATNTIPLRGRTVRFQARIKQASSTATWKAVLINWTGTADTSLAKNLVNNWASSTYTEGNFFTTNASYDIAAVGSDTSVGTSFTDVSVTGTVSSSANNLYVALFCITANHTNATITKCGLYDGVEARDWLPRSYQQELALCQRYFSKTYNADVTPGTATAVGVILVMTSSTNANTQGLMWHRPVTMRTTPTSTVIWNPTTGAASARQGDGNDRAMASITDGASGTFWWNTATITSGTTMFAHFSSDSEL